MARIALKPLRKRDRRKMAKRNSLPLCQWDGDRFYLELAVGDEFARISLRPREMFALFNGEKRAIREWLRSKAVLAARPDEVGAKRAAKVETPAPPEAEA